MGSVFNPRDPKWIKESREVLEPRGIIPAVIESTPRGERSWDLYSRLLKERIIFIGTPIDDQVANSIVAQLLYLQSEDATKDINMYINSLGGAEGQAADIEITAREILRLRRNLYEILAHHTGQTMERIMQDSDRNYYLTAQQAVEYGLIDDVLAPNEESSSR